MEIDVQYVFMFFCVGEVGCTLPNVCNAEQCHYVYWVCIPDTTFFCPQIWKIYKQRYIFALLEGTHAKISKN